MTGNIKIDSYNGELGNSEKKFMTDCVSQWNAFERKERMGTTQMLFVKELRFLAGLEAQTVCTRFVEREEELLEGEP